MPQTGEVSRKDAPNGEDTGSKKAVDIYAQYETMKFFGDTSK